MGRNQGLKSIVTVILDLIAGVILIAVMRSNPLEGYEYLFKGRLKNLGGIGNTVAAMTSLMLTGLSVAFAFRIGSFNTGAPGQMLFEGLYSIAVGLSLDLLKTILVLIVALAGILGGTLWATVPGILKAKFSVREAVSLTVMNWIAYWIVYYNIPKYFKGEFLETESKTLSDLVTLKTSWLSNIFEGSYINLGILLTMVAAFIAWFILNKTVLGYELEAVGFNKFRARYADTPADRNIVISVMMVGALSGLTGAIQYTGDANIMQIGVMSSRGFDGIVATLPGASNPVGVFFSALLFGVLYVGKGFMNTAVKVPPELADTITVTIIYFAATSVIMNKVIKRFRESKKDDSEGKSSSSGRVVEK